MKLTIYEPPILPASAYALPFAHNRSFSLSVFANILKQVVCSTFLSPFFASPHRRPFPPLVAPSIKVLRVIELASARLGSLSRAFVAASCMHRGFYHPFTGVPAATSRFWHRHPVFHYDNPPDRRSQASLAGGDVVRWTVPLSLFSGFSDVPHSKKWLRPTLANSTVRTSSALRYVH